MPLVYANVLNQCRDWQENTDGFFFTKKISKISVIYPVPCSPLTVIPVAAGNHVLLIICWQHDRHKSALQLHHLTSLLVSNNDQIQVCL